MKIITYVLVGTAAMMVFLSGPFASASKSDACQHHLLELTDLNIQRLTNLVDGFNRETPLIATIKHPEKQGPGSLVRHNAFIVLEEVRNLTAQKDKILGEKTLAISNQYDAEGCDK